MNEGVEDIDIKNRPIWSGSKAQGNPHHPACLHHILWVRPNRTGLIPDVVWIDRDVLYRTTITGLTQREWHHYG